MIAQHSRVISLPVHYFTKRGQ